MDKQFCNLYCFAFFRGEGGGEERFGRISEEKSASVAVDCSRLQSIVRNQRSRSMKAGDMDT